MKTLKASLWLGAIMCSSTLLMSPAASEDNVSMASDQKPDFTTHARLKLTVIVQSQLSLRLDDRQTNAQFNWACPNKSVPARCQSLSWHSESEKNLTQITLSEP